jgi:hypothetical protein
MMTVQCVGAVVTYPHRNDTLAVEAGRRPGLARKLRGLGLQLLQDGDREKTFLFPPALFDQVADAV